MTSSILGAALDRAFALAEAARSRRALGLAFFAVAGVLASAAWLRPAFSQDIKSFHLPLRMFGEPAPTADELLHGPRVARLFSPGGAMIAVIVVAALAVLRKPERLPTASGAILAATIVGNAVVAFNYPSLIERMDHEFEQRLQVAGPFAYRRNHEDSMATRDNARVGTWAVLTGDEQRGDPGRGWAYLLYGCWLGPLAIAGILVADARPLPVRFGRLAAWAGLGTTLAVLACSPRLLGEAAWRDAVRLDGRGDPDGAAESLARSARWFPELGGLERAWLLGGKIDHARGRPTPAATSYIVYQHMREKRKLRSMPYVSDLPWQIRRVTDLREGLEHIPGGFDMALDAGSIGGWTFDRRFAVERSSSGGTGLLLQFSRGREMEVARHRSQELLASSWHVPAVHYQAGRTAAEIGLEIYLSNLVELDDGRVSWPRSRMPTTSQIHWAEASRADPSRYDVPYYRGRSESLSDSVSPEAVRAAFAPILTRTVDRPLQADALCEIGDAYLRAGRLEEARRFYVESYDLFNIPEQHKNYRAQRRLGGL